MLSLQNALGSQTTPQTPLSLKVMTFNLRYAAEDGPHPWSGRRALIAQTIAGQAPDLIGTQEGLDHQLTDIAAALPQYGWIGEGRNGGRASEFSAIFYRKDRFRVVDHGNFWLSATPEIPGSRTWGNLLPRMATWGLFEEISTGARVYHFNTHFDHLFPHARTRSAELLSRRIAGRKFSAPVVVTGDFNTAQDGKVHTILTGGGPAGLADTWATASAREGQFISTFHNWRGPSLGGRRIDWILATPDLACRRNSVVTYNQDGRFPSDHFPVVSELTLGARTREPLIAERQTTSSAALR